MNSDVSNDGELMIANLREKLIEMDFLNVHDVQLILHSPLIRAKKTCYGLFAPGILFSFVVECDSFFFHW